MVDVRKKGSVELEAARHAEEAESLVLRQAEAAEAKLAQMLEEARALCELPPEDNDATAQALEGKESSTMQHMRSLLEAERAVINKCISAHKEKEASIEDDSAKRAADWQKEKAALEDELLRANLQMKAEDSLASAFKGITSRNGGA